VISMLPEQKSVKELGGTMRLGSYPCVLNENTKAYAAYERKEIGERHRHRYEFNNDYRDILEKHGMVISGESPDHKLVEIIELQDHPWFVACQFHPEFKSRPNRVHPLFRDFIGAALKKKK
jgi:CTP synthase